MGYFRVLADGRQGGYWAGVLGRYGPGMGGKYIQGFPHSNIFFKKGRNGDPMLPFLVHFSLVPNF